MKPLESWWKRRTRQMWRKDAQIQIYPTSTGTWTVRGFYFGGPKRFNEHKVCFINDEQSFQKAMMEVRVWLNQQIKDTSDRSSG